MDLNICARAGFGHREPHAERTRDRRGPVEVLAIKATFEPVRINAQEAVALDAKWDRRAVWRRLQKGAAER